MMTESRLKQKGVSELKRLVWIFGYFWVLLGLFALHKSVVLHEPEPFYHQGFAVLNALVLAKVVYLGEVFDLADNLKRKPMIYPIIYRSAVFSCILILSHVVEELIAKAWRGGFEALGSAGSLDVEELLVFGLIMFVSLTPFFALGELARDVGSRTLFEAFFVQRGAIDLSGPAQPVPRASEIATNPIE